MQPLSIITISGHTEILDKTVIRELRMTFGNKLILPGDADYDNTRRLWNGMIDKHPAMIIRCYGVADVIECVNFARTNRLLIAIRGSGHNVAGNATCDEGLMIDLSNMKGIHVDPSNRTVRAQPGVQLGELDRESQAFGLAVPGGLVSDTGIAGLTLGGGLGWLRRKYGLTCDNLVAVDLVTANGQFLTASPEENSDLFWGVRGGGGNFGIVTSFLYRAYPIGPENMFSFVFYPADKARTIFRHYREYTHDAPDEVSSMLLYGTTPRDDSFPESAQGKPCVIVAACYSGAVSKGRSALKSLRNLGRPLMDFSGPRRYVDIQRMFDAEYPHGRRYYWKSLYLHDLSEPVIAEILQFANRCPSPLSTIDIWHLGGAISKLADDETAISHRQTPFLLAIESNWDASDQSTKNITWTRDFWEAMQQFSDGGVFFNFPGFFEEGDKLMKTSFGTNYARLAELKREYDPSNLFRLNQNIQPQS